MALTQVYTAVPNDVISAARWNNEFGNIYNNGFNLVFPVTSAVSFAGFTITLDSSGVTTIISTGSQGISFTPGAKAGTPNTTGKNLDIVASTFTDSNTAGSGTAASFVGVALQRPTLAASNTLVTTTDAATAYIANSPAAGTNETLTNPWSLWVDAGHTRLDGNLSVQGDAALAVNPWRFTAAVGSNALTITLQNANGNTPSASNPVPIAFRSVTATTPELSTVLATAATTLTISSGSTLGTINGVANRIWIGALNNAGTVELFAYNSLSALALGAFPQAQAGPSIKGISESQFVTTTAEGGAGAADSSQVAYSTTARSTVAFRWLGYIESTQATAGTWATAPSKIQMVTNGVKFPGELVQRVQNFDTTVATGTTAIPRDNTTPLITEGDQYMSQAITPTFAGNVLRISVSAMFGHSAITHVCVALNDGTTVLAASVTNMNGAGASGACYLDYFQVANTVSATTWAIRAGASTGATTSFNGEGGTVRYNILASHIQVEEIAI